jgi:uncharacterized OB-fold protein
VADTATTEPALPGVSSVKIAADGRPFIEGVRCGACGAAFDRRPLACPACGARDSLKAFEASRRGVVHAYTIVMRSYPGVPTPFISCIVDLDDGLTLKGTLKGVEPKPSPDLFGLPVRVEFEVVRPDPQKPASYLIYVFEPA